MRIAALLATVALIVGVLGWHHSMRTGSLAPEGWPIPTWIVDYTRQEIWANVWQAGEGRRVFGLGINTVNLRSGTEAIDPVTRIETIPAHPHNWAVEVLVETGIVGFVPFLLVVAVSVWRLMRGYHRTGDGAVLAALCVAAGYWSSGLFNFSYWSAWWQVGFLALTAFCLAGRAPPRDA